MRKRIIPVFINLIILVTTIEPSSFDAKTIDPAYLSIPEGLSSAFVKNMIQDSYGLMWIGTDNGLHQYDGYKFTRFKNIPGESTSLLDDDVWGLAEDQQKNIWIAHESGVSKFDRSNNKFINYDFQEAF
ncbi:MAG: two-component regulator propeller domain-containing protein, partial [Melioribacteraceae bacterium]|nr:two-component regulator propeller domain-containing protein [Melioribacteraceae bacterium]